jgi:threonine/homoserine/homoserine lactone efflux protein
MLREEGMGLSIFLKGLLAGLVLCVPMGPIGLLCVRRTLMDGRMAGLVSLLGASTADGIYCSIAGMGVTYVASSLRHKYIPITILGGLVLVALGLRLFFTRKEPEATQSTTKGFVDAYVSSFLLMLANPMLILFFTALMTALGVHGWRSDYLSTAILVAGVITGSALWAPILVTAVSLFRPQFGPHHVVILNRISGIIIVGFGIGAGLMGLMR